MAYKYEGSQGKSHVQSMVHHTETHASANPEGKMYHHELRAFPPATWCTETEHIRTMRERGKVFHKVKIAP